MKELLKPHIGEEIGVNVRQVHSIDEAKLVAVHDDCFTVTTEKGKKYVPYSYFNIVKILENPDGATLPGFFKVNRSFPFVVKIGHVVEYVPT